MANAKPPALELVWRSSERLGCAVNLNCTNMFGNGVSNSVVVCRYDPPGNYAGQYLEQTGRLVATEHCAASASATPVA